MVNMKKKQEKVIKVSFCPKCKSNNVKFVFGLGNLFGVMPKMKCTDCGHSDTSFPILVTDKKKLAVAIKKIKAKKKIKKGGKK